MMLFKFALFTSSKVVRMMLRLTTVIERLLVTGLILTPVFAFSFPKRLAALSVNPQRGENIFRAKCAVCHGVDGAGDTANGKKLKVPDLRSSEVQSLTDEELVQVVTNGKKEMPPLGKKYSADRIQQVINYVRTLAQKN
jgi:mono/diheme cytochrome c family protein